jgi:NADH-quinone oxidoreductase subunit M
MMVSVFASAGLPGLNGFVGEFLILVGAFRSPIIWGSYLVPLATTGVILAAVYLLWLVYRTFFGEITDEANASMPDLDVREIALLLPLVVLMFWMGLAPAPFLERSEMAVLTIVATTRAKAALSARTPEAAVHVPLHWPAPPPPSMLPAGAH